MCVDVLYFPNLQALQALSSRVFEGGTITQACWIKPLTSKIDSTSSPFPSPRNWGGGTASSNPLILVDPHRGCLSHLTNINSIVVRRELLHG